MQVLEDNPFFHEILDPGKGVDPIVKNPKKVEKGKGI